MELLQISPLKKGFNKVEIPGERERLNRKTLTEILKYPKKRGNKY